MVEVPRPRNHAEFDIDGHNVGRVLNSLSDVEGLYFIQIVFPKEERPYTNVKKAVRSVVRRWDIEEGKREMLAEDIGLTSDQSD